MESYKLSGWIKDEPDSRDIQFKVSNKASNLPSEVILTEFTPISNQLSLGSCVANATCDALEMLQGYQGKDVQQLSRLFVYFNSRNYHKSTKIDNGTCIRYAFSSLKKLGVCLESTWKYDISKVFSQPNLQAYKEGDDNTISDYYSITSTGSNRSRDICTAIHNNHPVVFGTMVDDDFLNNRKYIYDIPSTPRGAHAMMIVGYRMSPSLEFKIRNSWSRSWGDNGYTWMTENYINSSLSSDFWVPTLMPNLIF